MTKKNNTGYTNSVRHSNSFIVGLVWMVVVVGLVAPGLVFSQEMVERETPMPTRADGTKTSLRDQAEQIREQVQNQKDQLLDQARERFGVNIDRMISKLQGALTHLPKGLDGSVSISMDIQIGDLVGRLETLKASAVNVSTRDDIRGLHDEALVILHETRGLHQRALGLVLIDRFNEHLAKMEEVATRVQSRLNDMNEKGIDVAVAQTSLNAYSAGLVRAQSSVSGAQTLFSSGSADSFEQAKLQLQEAKHSLYLAGQNLRRSLEELKHLANTREEVPSN